MAFEANIPSPYTLLDTLDSVQILTTYTVTTTSRHPKELILALCAISNRSSPLKDSSSPKISRKLLFYSSAGRTP